MNTYENDDSESMAIEPVNVSQLQPYQPPANPFDTDQKSFAMQVQQRGENYDMLLNWLCNHMVPGEDMVRVHFMSRSKCKHQGPPHCTPSIEPTHWSDPDLSKRGAEKICGLLRSEE